MKFPINRHALTVRLGGYFLLINFAVKNLAIDNTDV